MGVLLAAVVALSSAAANPYLEDAKRLYSQMQFDDALKRLQLARRVPSDDPLAQAEILDWLGRCQVAEGQRAAAEATFDELVSIAPWYAIDAQASPKIREVYA